MSAGTSFSDASKSFTTDDVGSRPKPSPAPVKKQQALVPESKGEEWNCVFCDATNPPERKACLECGKGRKRAASVCGDSVGSASPSPGASPQRLIPGAAAEDWACVFCDFTNPPERKACLECGKGRKRAASVCSGDESPSAVEIEKPAPSLTPTNVAVGDPWDCAFCDAANPPERKACLECGKGRKRAASICGDSPTTQSPKLTKANIDRMLGTTVGAPASGDWMCVFCDTE
ncbi:MAG: hypothetical protein V2I33_21155, partial [Kangiellaceae bacterium]|nr:hypothetical protein [Kangiellaceae bacterium]